MADALISIVLEQVTTIILREVEQEVKLVVGVKKELKRLESNLQSIRGVLADAEEKQLEEIAVKQWLDRLKAVSYNMDDVLDEWSTALLKSLVEGDDHDAAAKPDKRKVLSMIQSSCFCFRQVGLRHDIAHKIKELNESLNEIKIQKDMFGFDVNKGTSREAERQITTSVIDVTEVRSREQEKDKIVSLLLSDSSQSSAISTISIVGMGGIGKTTLAQLAFNGHEVKANFNKTIWVCVSYPFDSMKITKAILESLLVDAQRFGALETIVKEIAQTIRGKKFLLVLDDMWDDGPEKWRQLKHCFQGGLSGSKILVTTRSESVAKSMGCARNNLLQLGRLPLEECWLIFSQIAFFDRDEERGQLEIIGREIVNKCDGLPLAAKALGSLLCLKNSVQEWRDVLTNPLWELPGIWEAKTGLASLWLSYHDLPLELRQCFSSCAIFPEDHEIEKDKLIDMWMAQGYIGATSTKKDMETHGEELFQDLTRRCFFQDLERKGGVMKCKMHDVMRDFARYLTKNECSRLEVKDCEEQTEQPSCREPRHLRIVLGKESSFPSSICEIKNLRTLWVQSHGNKQIGVALSNVFSELTCLRSLILHDCDITDIPSSINNLLHLRQLDLSSNRRLRKLPENTCELYNLQTLDVSRCEFVKLPERIENLVNLRSLYNFRTKYLPKAVRRLTSLRTLTEFIISNDPETACSLGDLNNLNELRGELSIKGLGNIKHVGEAKEAQLNRKVKITRLGLFFNGEENECRKTTDEGLLEALQPPPTMEHLRIVSYKGTKLSPTWLFWSNNLKKLVLECSNYEHLPALWRLPALEWLCLDEMTGLQKLGVEFVGMETNQNSSAIVAFPQLKHLIFYWIWNWDDWDSVTTSNAASNFTIMPSLRSLTIFYCPELKALPDYILQSKSLEELKVHECPILHERYKTQQQHNTDEWRNPNIRSSCFSVSDIERTKIFRDSVLEDPKGEVLREHESKLKEMNKDLAEEVEGLHADRSDESEELTYLRWVNSCLRYELRNLQPAKTFFRDTSESLSPRSEKAKKLIFEYANIEEIETASDDSVSS